MTSNPIKCGAVLPGGTATQQLELAQLAEESGWDGVFTWEAAYGVDAWSLLGAMAVRTSRVKLGTMLTPLPWRRPWKVASQVATVDQLSNGRAILAIGVGATETELPDTHEETGLRERAAMMDEGIDLIRGLWEGRGYEGEIYRFRSGRMDLAAAGRPAQGRIPIWVVGVWPGRKSMRRVLRCDGVIPQYRPPASGTPDDARAVRHWLSAEGAGPGFDIVADGESPAADPAGALAQVTPWHEAGCTWWLETRWGTEEDLAERLVGMRDRLAAGPPRPKVVGADDRITVAR